VDRIPFEVTGEDARRLLAVEQTRSYDFGTYQATLNGVKLREPMVFYPRTRTTGSII